MYMGSQMGPLLISVPKKIAILLDGGHVRVYARKAKFHYTPDYIELVSRACVKPDEEIHRVLY